MGGHLGILNGAPASAAQAGRPDEGQAGHRRGAELAPRVGVDPGRAAVLRVRVPDAAAALRAGRGDAVQHEVREAEAEGRVDARRRGLLPVGLERAPDVVRRDIAEVVGEAVQPLAVEADRLLVARQVGRQGRALRRRRRVVGARRGGVACDVDRRGDRRCSAQKLLDVHLI